MKKRSIIWITVVALLIGTFQTFLLPQVANAGSLNFGTNGSGAPTGGTVSIPYNENQTYSLLAVTYLFMGG
jgi:hypothetical protein